MNPADFVYTFIPIFVAMDVGGLIPVYLSLTRELTPKQRRLVSWQALMTALLISVAFVLAGRLIFRVLGITASDFLIGGGALLLVLAIVDLVRGGQRVSATGLHVGAVPLGTPLMIGPAVLTTLLILISLRGYALTLAALLANLLVAAIAFRLSERLVKWIGQDGLRASSQVVSLFLAAIAVSMIRQGFQTLH